eukprot:scaffold1598_cov285-Prasinococcus_capsulatus_cf.AAC.5
MTWVDRTQATTDYHRRGRSASWPARDGTQPASETRSPTPFPSRYQPTLSEAAHICDNPPRMGAKPLQYYRPRTRAGGSSQTCIEGLPSLACIPPAPIRPFLASFLRSQACRVCA